MLSLDQIQRELKAILEFDIVYLAAHNHYPDEVVGFQLHEIYQQELLGLAKTLASRN
jgi:hypothetical protein